MSFTVSSIWILYEHDNQQAFYEQVMWIKFTAFDYHNSGPGDVDCSRLCVMSLCVEGWDQVRFYNSHLNLQKRVPHANIFIFMRLHCCIICDALSPFVILISSLRLMNSLLFSLCYNLQALLMWLMLHIFAQRHNKILFTVTSLFDAAFHSLYRLYAYSWSNFCTFL